MDMEHTATWNYKTRMRWQAWLGQGHRHGSHCLLKKELAEGQLQKTREASDYKRRVRLQDTREMTSLTRTGTQTWNTLLIKKWAGRRPAPKDKRSTSLQENTETTRHARDDKPNTDKDTDMDHTHGTHCYVECIFHKRRMRLQDTRERTSLKFKRQEKHQSTREHWDYKTRARWQA